MVVRFPAAALLAATAGLLLPAAAHATDRFVSPDETRLAGFDCLTVATACALGKAMQDSPNSIIVGAHTVTLLPGTYDSTDIDAGATFPGTDLFVKTGLTIQGQPGQPAPVIRVNTSNNLFNTVRATSGGVLRDLVIERTGATGAVALDINGLSTPSVPVTVERVVVSGGTDGSAIRASGTVTIKNTLARQAGGTLGSGIAMDVAAGESIRLVNVSAESAGTALDIFGSGSAPSTLELVNTYARGAIDLRGSTSGTGAVTIATTTSAIRSAAPFTTATGPITVSGSPLTIGDGALDASGAPPAGSPLIDAGTASADAGTADVFGKLRTSGTAIDIGAAEFQAPPPVPLSPQCGCLPPATPPGPPAPPAPDTTAPTATSLKPPKTLKRSKLTKGKGVKLTATLSEPVASAKLELLQITKKKGKKPKEKPLGSATLGAGGPSLSFNLKIKASKLGKKGKLKLTLRFAFVDAAGNRTVVDKPVTVN